jgi:hypothetical protein
MAKESSSILERPFLYVEQGLEDSEREPADHCCCRCCGINLTKGTQLCVWMFIIEASWHLLMAWARPSWEWTSTTLTIVAFWIQNTVRVVMIPMACYALSGLGQRKDKGLQTFFRFTLVLIVLELVEMVVKFWEVHAVCEAAQKHRKRPHTAEQNARCEWFSDICECAPSALLHTIAKN